MANTPHFQRPSRGIDVNNDASICRRCNEVNRRKRSRTCFKCKTSYHLSCVGLTYAKSSALKVWNCSQCVQINSFTEDSTSTTSGDLEHISAENLLEFLSANRQTRPILRIPKGSRSEVASALADCIHSAIDRNDDFSWAKLYLFPKFVLCNPKSDNTESNSRSLTTILKTKAKNYVASKEWPKLETNYSESKKPKTDDESIKRRVTQKLCAGDIRAAVSTCCSDDTIAARSIETLSLLQSKHPPAPDDLRDVDESHNCSSPPLQISNDDVIQAIDSFSPSTSGGPDGLQPIHLKDLCSKQVGDMGVRLLSSITKLVNTMLVGNISEYARTLLFSADLIALKKKDGGIRPIAMGNVFRRMASKVAAKSIRQLGASMAPIQLGFGIRNGCEAAAHALRLFAENSDGRDGNELIVKLDVSNAFNCLRRDCILDKVFSHASHLFPLVKLAYGEQSFVCYDGNLIPSTNGIQQGDPLGPPLFAMTIHDASDNLHSPFNVWYLDDITLGGDCEKVTHDLSIIIPKLESYGLHLNSKKCEITNLNIDPTKFDEIKKNVEELTGVATTTTLDSLELLGAPIKLNAIRSKLEACVGQFNLMCQRLKLLDSHPAFFLLSHCLGMPKASYLLRSSPCYLVPDMMNMFDDNMRAAAENICNVKFDDTSWSRATLPIRYGGIGLRSPSDLALPCYTSSLSTSDALVNKILSTSTGFTDDIKEHMHDTWQESHNINLSTPGPYHQRELDELLIKPKITKILDSCDQYQRASALAASHPHSGAWLTALPIPANGCLLTNETFQIGVCQRVLAKLCHKHTCRCGKEVDEYGLHPLSCSKSAGRFPRHTELNAIVRRALQSAGIPSLLEPVGLDREDGKRPDGMTIMPFSSGKSLVWDATCVDTFSNSAILDSATKPGSAAESAERLKLAKYTDLQDRYRFEPIAFETTCVAGKRTMVTVSEIGKRLSMASGEKREGSWLWQRLTISILRGNAFSVRSAADY